MSDTSKEILQQAFTLIENGEPEKAQEILAPLLQDDADNVHLWWVYTHAVQDASIGLAALERVLELDPKYPGARELKADVLKAQSRDPDLIALEASGSDSPAVATMTDVDDWEDLQPVVDVEASGSSIRGRVALLVVVLVIVVAGGLILSGAVDLSQLLSGILPSPEPQVIVISESTIEPTPPNQESEATQAPPAATATSEPAAEASQKNTAEREQEETAPMIEQDPSPIATEKPTATATAMASPTSTATISTDSMRIASFVSSVAEMITDFTIVPLKSGMLPTRLGDTLVIFVCAIPGPEFNHRLTTVLNTVVSLEEDLPEDIEAVAAGLVNCDDTNAGLRIVGVTRATISAFANEEIDSKEFQRAWQPLS
ncbi:MAG: hypothetical protein OXG53_19500 [Chloroflexi bacterium]|nr:hypothetical protein [Chloroflexota bacterium]